jgi:aspartate dehydrogenase
LTRLRVGLIGLGAIGAGLAELVARDAESSIELVGALVRDPGRARAAQVPQVATLAELLELRPDVVAEAAGHAALREFGPACLRASVPLVLLSVGALADADFEAELTEAAREGRVAATIASGGTAALDMIASASEDGLESVVHTIVKPPGSLGVEVDAYTELYRGPARAGAAQFPQNANIAAAIALAGVGLDRSEVVIAADPAATTNRQQIEAKGAFGSLRVEIDSRPSASNPRTGAVVAMSLKHALERRVQTLVVG